ncbi:unnamed protein product [Lathyrus sativus]|nr:unnamed protein product [Lathyrus sativus]
MRTILLSFLISYYFIYLTLVVSAKCLQHQQSLLLQLKNNLTFPPQFSTKLKLWNENTPCCNWSGVTCDHEGHVIGLDLCGEEIYGGIDNSSSLFTLQHLQKLNLAHNDFDSSIPSGFGKLVMLKYLNLSYSYNVGNIPMEISKLTRLVTLDLSSDDSFSQEQRRTIYNRNLQTFLQNLTSLRQLYLNNINISGMGKEWGNALLPLHDLRELSMSYCDLSGPLDSSLTKLVNLSILILKGNNFSSSVPETFANLKNLTILSLSDCGLTDKFPQKIFRIETLSDIDLSFNYDLHGLFPDYSMKKSLHSIILTNTQFSGTIPHTISNMRLLSHLDLSYCHFNGTLPNSLSNLTHLIYLDLSYNYLSDQIPYSLSNLTQLTFLDLSNNNLSGQIPYSLSNLTQLTFLYLSDNNLSGQIPYSLSNLTHLTGLDLSYNNLSGRIPSFLFTLPAMKEIMLSSNKFIQFDKFINVSSSVLEVLYAHSNNLVGPFPTPIFKIHSLSFLDLSFNMFNGSLQLDKILKLRNLTDLNLSHNNISIDVNVSNVDFSSIPKFKYLSLATCNLKFFPNFLINQSTLTNLDLSNNQIEGEIPNWIWNLQDLQLFNLSHNFLSNLEGPFQNLTSKLETLDLHNNKLQGSIPAFPHCAYTLDYSNNNFSIIPQDIGNYLLCTNFLSFSKNNLQGSIPVSLCNASQLQVLDISFNNFSGTIPPCLITMTNTLEVLNIKANNLSGPITDVFPNYCAVTRLNFHGNQLQGPIPMSLSHCSSLELLDIGSNQIVDHFPCFLNNIPALSVLVLRNNRFHGSMECSENKPWKSIQIVDIAFNNFNGKLLKKYFTTWERMMYDEDVAREIGYMTLPNYQYYHDSLTVTWKGQQQDLVKILTIFKAIDFSSNFFEGPIPESLMDLKALYILNFSNNGLTGEIPSAIGNMKQLESLDFSNNSLVGEIPVQLASLSFLSYLNLSFNHLMGKIPTGTQLQTFSASSFEGNHGLYGPPLNETPEDKMKDLHPQAACEKLVCSIDWNFLSVELGFVFGLGIIICPIMFWKKWRVRYWKSADKILCRIFPWMHLEYATDRGKTYTVLRW